MRPVSLNVSGLQSFREQQTIPFGELCSGGVFGIFGPTGSGKSTILDAVTLALYGKVERAAGGTNGIMNQAEDKLSVSFTFQLGQGAEEKHYTVERSYKRTGDHTIRTSTSRLIEIQDGDSIVHADKERDVTRLVQELIGLTIEDFTRAVVLPQGKFSEFLSLKGADRRQMLQRLFQLEKYGDALTVKLKRRMDDQKNRLNEITAEQAGLGHASREALEDAVKQLKEKELALQTISSLLEKEEEALNQTKAYWEIQTEFEALLKQQEELDLHLPEMEALQIKLKQALFADRLKPYADEWQDSLQNENMLHRELQQLEKVAKEYKSLYEEAEKQFDAARRIKEKDEPLLIEKRSKLQDAFEWEKKLKQKKTELIEETEHNHKLKDSFSQSKKEEDDAVSLLLKGRDKQTALKEELISIEISPSERDQFEKARLLIHRLQSIQAEETKIHNELNKALADKEALKQNVIQVKGKVNDSIDQWRILSDTALSLYNDVCSALSENETLMNSLQENLFSSKKKQEKVRVHYLAAQLSSQLKENEPCAVCGSTVHPSPLSVWEDNEMEDENIEYLEAAKESLQNLQRDLHHVSETLEKLSRKIFSKLGTSGEETAATNDQLLYEESKIGLLFQADRLNEHDAKVKGILQDRLGLEEKFDKLATLFEKQQKQLEQLTFEQKTVDERVTAYQQDLSDTQVSKETVNADWKSAAIPFELEKMEERHLHFKERDKRQSEIQKSLEVAVGFLEKQAYAIEKLKDGNKDLEFKISTSLNRQKTLEDEVKDLHKMLYERLGEKSAEEQHNLVEKQLQTILANYQLAEERMKKAGVSYQDSDKAFHSLVQRFEDAQKRKAKAESQWTDKLKSSAFDSFDVYLQSVTDEKTIHTWEQKITHYFDQCKGIKTAIETQKNKLPLHPLSEENVNGQNEKVEKLKKETDATREAVGQARQQWLTIEQNHIRFQELETDKEKVTLLLEKLGKLQAVFRGNAFVEFMAEEQLMHVTRDASNRLSKLTRGRYAIEVDSSGGFVIRDDANGGIKRPVTSLSGGETFLTSLALALSLSAQIQLRGKFPLQFFFLDEGFGTLDQELLDTVVTALEKVQMENFAIGVISHVPELKARLTKRLIVEPAEHSGRGTRVRMDQL